MSNSRHFAEWLRLLAIWLFKKPRLVWFTALAVPFALLAAYVLTALLNVPAWEPRIRIGGMLLQLLGLGTVAYGFFEIERVFGRPSLIEVAKKWASERPRLGAQTVIVPGTGGMSMGGVAGIGFANGSLGPTATLEERIAHLESRVTTLNDLILKADKKIDDEATKRQETLNAERQEREAADHATRRLIERAAADGIYVEMMGTCWLFFGIALATGSPEIAKYL